MNLWFTGVIPNPYKAKYEAARLKARPLPATKAQLQAKLDRLTVCFSMALKYLSSCEQKDFGAQIKALDGKEVTARARELERLSSRF